MVKDLKLKGNELLIYAIIYGFSQDGKSQFTGSLQYLADWTNSTKQGVLKALKTLCAKQLILKNEYIENGVKYCAYIISGYSTKFNRVLNKVECNVKQSLMGCSTKFNEGIKQSLPNNICDTIRDNINNNIADNTEKRTEFKQFVQNVYDAIYRHNETQIENRNKIPIPDGLFNFEQMYSRSLYTLASKSDINKIKIAFTNYLEAAKLPDRWQDSFGLKYFFTNYVDFTSNYFDIEKYKKSVKENIKKLNDDVTSLL